MAIAIAALIYSHFRFLAFRGMLEKNHPVRKCAAAYMTRAKFLSRAALQGVAPTGLVTYSREEIKSPGGYG